MKQVVAFLLTVFSSTVHAGYPEKLERALSKKMTTTRKCSQVMASMAAPPQGKDRLTMIINKDGILKKFDYETSELANKPYWDCLKSSLEGTLLPKPPGKMDFTHVTYMTWQAPSGDSYVVQIVKERVLKENESFQKCYSKYIEEGGVKTGEILFAWAITPHGKVQKLEIKRDEIGNKGLGQCLRGLLQKVEFPRPPAESQVEVTFPLKFFRTK